jgi:hypothetical protein
MTDTPDTSSTDFPATPIPLDRDIPCARCAYNLRTQMPNGRCPECGAPVADALRRYVRVDAGWMRTVAWGIWSIVVGGVVTAMAIMASVSNFTIGYVAWDFGIVVCQILPVVGVWLFTKPNPVRPAARGSNITGWIARVTATVYLVALISLTALADLFHRAQSDLIDLLGRASIGIAAGLTLITFGIHWYFICRWLGAKYLLWQLRLWLPAVAVSIELSRLAPDRPVFIFGLLAIPVLVILWLPVALVYFAMSLQQRADWICRQEWRRFGVPPDSFA